MNGYAKNHFGVGDLPLKLRVRIRRHRRRRDREPSRCHEVVSEQIVSVHDLRQETSRGGKSKPKGQAAAGGISKRNVPRLAPAYRPAVARAAARSNAPPRTAGRTLQYGHCLLSTIREGVFILCFEY